MINVLQKVTTFPIELMDLPIFLDISGQDIHNYYSKNGKNPNGTITDDEILSVDPNKDWDNITKRFILYNAIYDKLFTNISKFQKSQLKFLHKLYCPYKVIYLLSKKSARYAQNHLFYFK